MLSDTYNAKAYNKESLMTLLNKNAKHTSNIIICTAIFVISLPAIIITIMLVTFFCSKSHRGSQWVHKVKRNQSVVVSLTLLSGIANLYIFSLDIAALVYWHHCLDDEEVKLFHDFDIKRNLGPLVFITIVDISCTFVLLPLIVFFSICVHLYKVSKSTNTKHKSLNSDHTFIILSLAVLCPLFSTIVHSPYIAIAYLNDSYHASSIFIYYTVLGYIFFGVAWLFFHWCQHHCNNSQESTSETATGQLDNGGGDTPGEEEKQTYYCCGLITHKATNQRDGGETAGQTEKPIYYCCGRITYKARDQGDGGGETPQNNEKQRCCCYVLTTSEELDERENVKCCGIYVALMTFLFIALFFLLGLVVVITCYFVLIPINKAISDAPSHILSIYQSGGFLIGSFIVYRILVYFYKKDKED